MCLICIDLQKGTLTTAEARRNLTELKPTLSVEHAAEIDDVIAKKEFDEIFDELNELLNDESFEQLSDEQVQGVVDRIYEETAESAPDFDFNIDTLYV